jgi:hypothetical protein
MTRTLRSSRRRGLALALALAVAGALASCTTAPATTTAQGTGAVELRWYCWNGIFTPAGTGGDRWWAGGFPSPTGPVEASPAPDDGNHEHVATGVLVVTGPDTATFTASTGGQLPLKRVAPDTVFPAYCQLTPS